MNRKGIEIRKANIADAADIARVHTNSWLTTYRGIVSDSHLDKKLSNYESGKAVKIRKEVMLQSGCESIYVALIENKIVGFVDGGKNSFEEYPFDSEIYAIYLEEDSQGIGIGCQLFKHFIENYLIPKGFKSLSIHVLKENPSAIFYEKMGGKLFRSELKDIAGSRLEISIYGWDDIYKLRGNSET